MRGRIIEGKNRKKKYAVLAFSGGREKKKHPVGNIKKFGHFAIF